MNGAPRHILSLLLCVLSLSGVAGAQGRIRVYAKVDAQTAIYAGDSFVYSVVVEGQSKPDRIDISSLAPFNPRPAGSGTSMQTFIDRTTISYSENYAITAGQPGTMQLPPVTVVIGGQTYTTNPVEVTVSKPGTTDRMTLEFTLSEQQCYVGQPVVMTVKWTVTARVQDAAFDVPVFKSDDFYIEDIAETGTAYAQDRATIHGVPITVTENRQLIRGMEAAIISFRKVLIPKRPGRITLDPVTASVNMAVGRVRTNDFFNPYQMKYERVSVQSNPAELNVLPLPEAGKPPQFYGLVGRYTISASASPTDVSVGDPITLTLRIGGNPYLKPVQWPELGQVPDLAANFKVPSERASPVVEGGAKVFTQTIRANNDAVTEVPAIPLAFFDPDRGQFVVATTDPVPLKVAASKVLTDADVEGLGPTSFNREVEAVRKGMSANYYGPSLLVDQRFTVLSALTSPGYAAIWSIPLLGLLVSAAVKIAGRTTPESQARKRKRNAARTAIGALKNAVALSLPSGQHLSYSSDRSDRTDGTDRTHRTDTGLRPGEAAGDGRLATSHGVLLSAMKGYIGDRFGRVAASLTADDCYRAIVEVTGDTMAAARYRDLIATCEAARYAPVEAEIGSDQVQEAIELIQSIERRARA